MIRNIKQCIFLGSQQNVKKWYQMADLFVLPTAYDPFSNSCLEALACGCPVITTRSNGASECINSRNGLVVHSPKEVFSEPAVNWVSKAKIWTEVRFLNRFLSLLQKMKSKHTWNY